MYSMFPGDADVNLQSTDLVAFTSCNINSVNSVLFQASDKN